MGAMLLQRSKVSNMPKFPAMPVGKFRPIT
jgi:hypothetical protein